MRGKVGLRVGIRRGTGVGGMRGRALMGGRELLLRGGRAGGRLRVQVGNCVRVGIWVM